jgi:hypothetical protein
MLIWGIRIKVKESPKNSMEEPKGSEPKRDSDLVLLASSHKSDIGSQYVIDLVDLSIRTMESEYRFPCPELTERSA